MPPPRAGFGGGQTPNPYNHGGSTPAGGGRTPGWGTTGRTPNPYNDSRTPAWAPNSRTPNPYANSSKTPAWDSSARTPNPYTQGDGGKTPAWNSSSRTPNPYANGGGASTWGGATPGRPTNSSNSSGWDTWVRRAPCNVMHAHLRPFSGSSRSIDAVSFCIHAGCTNTCCVHLNADAWRFRVPDPSSDYWLPTDTWRYRRCQLRRRRCPIR